MSESLLSVNAGSSSLKLAVFEIEGAEERRFSAEVERIGSEGSGLRIEDRHGKILLEERREVVDHSSSLESFAQWLRKNEREPIAFLGHRVVHGGARHRRPEEITPGLLEDLRELAAIDPDHSPQALAVIEASRRAYPAARQFACFDTGFHRTMPRVARMYALPLALFDSGLIRYGFHGLSCEYVVESLKRTAPADANGRLVVAHLGSGASMTAIRAGESVETTMGFSPTGGLAMGTRSGDLDPSVLLYLMAKEGGGADRLRRLVNQESGLLGVSGVSADVRDLLERESSDPRAADAIAIFCHAARKFLGALVAVLGGLDTLVFTGGIGEHAAPVRERICTGLECLGIELDHGRNTKNDAIVSRAGARVTVRVMKADEELMIARHVRRLLSSEGVGNVRI